MKRIDDEMKPRDRIVFIFIILVVSLLIFNAMLKGDGTKAKVAVADIIYIKEGNIYKGFFTEPFETLLLIFKDGTVFALSTHHAHSIQIHFGWLCDFLKRKGKTIEDLIIAIHNHSIPASFTEGNMFYYHKLREAGFTGLFCIYYTFSGKVRVYEED